MSQIDRVREALTGFSQLREIETPGGVVFEWDGDALAGVENDVPRVRVEGGWAAAGHDLAGVVVEHELPRRQRQRAPR